MHVSLRLNTIHYYHTLCFTMVLDLHYRAGDIVLYCLRSAARSPSIGSVLNLNYRQGQFHYIGTCFITRFRRLMNPHAHYSFFATYTTWTMHQEHTPNYSTTWVHYSISMRRTICATMTVTTRCIRLGTTYQEKDYIDWAAD